MRSLKIMFVCHGNICRSPMAEFIMKDLVMQAGLVGEISVSSAATSTEELGSPVYPPARAELARHGLRCDGKFAVQVKKNDYEKYDLFVVMDSQNLRNIMRIFGGDPQGKVRLLLEFDSGSGHTDVADPWYTRDFSAAYADIERGCKALLAQLAD